MIPIQNVYYMLSYAFQVLQEQGYKDIATEEFENTAELFAAILSKGISSQVKRGLGKSYIPNTERLSLLRGKLEVTESIKTQAILRQQMVCTYDDFSVNTYMNRIIKSSLELLMRSDISKARKKELRKLWVYFQDVDTLDLHTANWNIQYNRNNQTYQLLISICYLLVKGLLQTNSEGQSKLMDFLDEQRMCRLYEKFILEYYRKEFPQLTVSASQIPWALDDGMNAMLPVMQSDIMLSRKDIVLIIDAKYYTHSTQVQYDAHTLHSNNLYQIFTYVKNKDTQLAEKGHTVSGMLLYARTEDEIQPDQTYQMSGNRIDVKTLDLNRNFSTVAKQLDSIIEDFFGIHRELVD
ncbi:MAG: 5-methylcytosine-specific restriction endonuclease system specificity protein McrC [Lachnospiraceae bacterium]|nr:5-methylcytosine-specific restriction endonuclease system specificity protein McrC [Lachnospiraceae bacterium]